MQKGQASSDANQNRQARREKYKRAKPLERAVRRDHFNGAVAYKGNKSRSEKSRAKWRNDPRRDAVIFRHITEKLRDKQPVRLCSDSSRSVYLSRKTLAEAKRQRIPIIPNLFIPHWDHSSSLLKLLGWGLASEALGAFPFTLRISPEIMSQALASNKGPARFMQERISRYLRNQTSDAPIDFWFVIEQGEGEEPHLHGSIVIPRDDQGAIIEALRAAGGLWEPRSRQLQISEKKGAIQWVGYSTKWLMSSGLRMNATSLFAANLGMKREAKLRYQEARDLRRALYPV